MKWSCSQAQPSAACTLCGLCEMQTEMAAGLRFACSKFRCALYFEPTYREALLSLQVAVNPFRISRIGADPMLLLHLEARPAGSNANRKRLLTINPSLPERVFMAFSFQSVEIPTIPKHTRSADETETFPNKATKPTN